MLERRVIARTTCTLILTATSIFQFAILAVIHSEWTMPVDFLSLFKVLGAASVRYVVVGGVATILHGVDRLTADIDLVLDLTPESAQAAMRTLIDAGYRPGIPIDPMQFAIAEVRERWIHEKSMQVLNFWDTTASRPSVDVFVKDVIPFGDLWRDSQEVDYFGQRVRVASIEHLIRMKAIANRPRDLQDIERTVEKVTQITLTPLVSDTPPVASGSFADAEILRIWAFQRRTPAQRLNWLAEMMDVAYQSGALKHPALASKVSEPTPQD